MNRLALPSAMLALTTLLTACPGNTDPIVQPVPAPTQSLTVAVSGVQSASVTVTNTTANKVEFNGAVSGSKVLANLPKDAIFKVEGAAVNGYTTPESHSVTLGGDKTVTLNYAAIPVTYDLTINVTGVAKAPITVTNTSTNQVIFTGEVTGSKVIAALPKDAVLKIEGGSVNGYTMPAAQNVTMDAAKAVSVNYAAKPPQALPTGEIRLSAGGSGRSDQEAVMASVALMAHGDAGPIGLTSGLVQNDLTFALPAVDPVVMAPTMWTPQELTDAIKDCQGTINFSDMNQKLVMDAELNLFLKGQTYPDHVTAVTASNLKQMVWFYYADRPGSITADFTCPNGVDKVTAKYTLSLVKGWNMASVDVNSTNGFVVTIKSIPMEKVVMVPFTALSANSLKTLSVTSAEKAFKFFHR